MPDDERSADVWLIRGIAAYQDRRFGEAVKHFEQAVAMDSVSVKAHFALGAACLTLYKKRPSPPSPDFDPAKRDISEGELTAYFEQEKVVLAEQNSTNWPLAEKSLRRANQLNPEDKLVIEYLCALYFFWKDPLNEENRRLDEAKQWLERLAEVDPENRYANYYCGMLLCNKAHKLLPSHGRLPELPERELASLHKKVGPLLEEAKRHLSRVLSLDQQHMGALHFMADVTSMETYLADPVQSARELRERWADLFRDQQDVNAETKQAAGNAIPAGSSAFITFHLSPEALAEEMARPFPPNPWRI